MSKRIPIVLALMIALQMSARAQAPSAPLNYPLLVMFVKNALTAVNHGNLTGNYSVLRDLGSAGFREKNTAADLANAFVNHRKQHFDLSPILITEPQFTEQPTEIKPGFLKMVGFFPTQPQAVQFAIVYQRTEKGWGIDELSIGMAPINSLVQTATPIPQITPAAHQQP